MLLFWPRHATGLTQLPRLARKRTGIADMYLVEGLDPRDTVLSTFGVLHVDQGHDVGLELSVLLLLRLGG